MGCRGVQKRAPASYVQAGSVWAGSVWVEKCSLTVKNCSSLFFLDHVFSVDCVYLALHIRGLLGCYSSACCYCCGASKWHGLLEERFLIAHFVSSALPLRAQALPLSRRKKSSKLATLRSVSLQQKHYRYTLRALALQRAIRL